MGHNNNNYNKNKQTKKFFILKRYDGDVTLGWPYNASEAALKFINKVTCYPHHNKTQGANYIYRQISNISRTKYQNLNMSCVFLQLSLPNSLKPGVKSRTKM